jgi:hypothetical protein
MKEAAKAIRDYQFQQDPLLVLKSIALGRELVKTEKGVVKWKDNIRYPSLRNAVTSELFQKDLIELEYESGKPHIEENLTGRVLMTTAGKLTVKKVFGWVL